MQKRWSRAKIVSRDEIPNLISHLDSIAFTSGVFDIFHAGHADFLERASHYATKLVVGINTDYSVRANKGPKRPILADIDRASTIAACEYVDYVFLFNETNNAENIRILQPKVYIKGGDYNVKKLSSAKLVEEYGGRVLVLPIRKDLSTTKIIEKIINGDKNAYSS